MHADRGKMKIGLEVHVELDTETKLFCPCPRVGDDGPNSRTCPVCFGEPGAKPFLNRKAVEMAVRACIALNSDISPDLEFARKSYFYPDLAKNFQITQYENPIGRGGHLDIGDRRIHLKRIHLEEDPASISYPSSPKSSKYSLIDYNRSGSPLIEIVTEPWEGEPEDAKAFLRKLMDLLEYIGVFNPEKCAIKCDVNVSIEDTGWKRVEIKNVTGFREVEKAIAYEAMRQKSLLRFGGSVGQETRGWDPSSGTTYLLRGKEAEEDYGYIPEPNIPAVPISELIEEERKRMPELPWDRARRFVTEYGISEDDAEVICSSFELSEMFESLASKFRGREKELAHWIRKEVLKVINHTGRDLSEFPVDRFAGIMDLLFKGSISDALAKEMIKSIFDRDPIEMVREPGDVEAEVKRAVIENRKAVEDLKNGKIEALNFLVGEVMRNHPEFDPRNVRELIIKLVGVE